MLRNETTSLQDGRWYDKWYYGSGMKNGTKQHYLQQQRKGREQDNFAIDQMPREYGGEYDRKMNNRIFRRGLDESR